MSRKNILILAVIIFILSLAFMVYNFFFTENTPAGETIPTENIQSPFGDFFPVENNSNNFAEPESAGNSINPNVPNNNSGTIPRLRQIASVPVAGAIVYERVSTSTNEILSDQPSGEFMEVVFRYIERATGHIFETTSHNATISRVSNNTIPTIYEAFFLDNPDEFIVRYLNDNKEIETYVATIMHNEDSAPTDDTATSTPSSGQEELNDTYLEGFFLPDNINQLTLSPNKSSVFALMDNPEENESASILGYVIPLNNPSSQEIVFSSPISEWIASWDSTSFVNLNTKPSDQASGFLYQLNLNNESVDKLVGPKRGLNTLVSPDQSKVLYSSINVDDIEMTLDDLTTGEARKLSLQTLVEKCIWGEDNNTIYCAVPNSIPDLTYPDFWYMGLVSFNDSIMRFDIENEEYEVLMLPNSETIRSLDIINLQLSPEEDFLMFQNKTDLTLWSLDIQE